MARFCAGLSATCAADAPGASSAPTVWAVTSGTMAKHASKAAITGVEKTVKPLMLLRARVSEISQTIPRRPAWFLVKARAASLLTRESAFALGNDLWIGRVA